MQFEAFQNKVDDKSIKLGGNQTIKTYDGYVFPLDFTDGLTYLRLRPSTDSEWDELPYIFMTSDTNWDLTIYDNDISDLTTWYDDVANESTPLKNLNFDQSSNYRHSTVAKHSINEQLNYFDTTSFETPDEDANMLLCMNTAIITIPDDNWERVSASNNTMRITPSITGGNVYDIVTPTVANGNTDDECVIIPPPDQSLNMTKSTPKPIKVSENKPDYESSQPLFG